MIKFNFIAAFYLFLCLGNLFGELQVVDKIVARVNGVNILKSDLDKPRLNKNGQFYSLDEMINEELLCQKAAERKLLPSDLEVEKQISSLKIYNNLSHLSDKDFEEELKKEGLNLQDYKNQLARMLACEKLKHAEFSERVVVTSQEVEEYYKKNPEMEHETYLLKMSTISKDCLNQKGEFVKKVDYKWDDLGWIEKKDLSSSLSFVSKMKVNQISKPKKMGYGYQMVKLEAKKMERLKTLDERYSEIDLELQKQKKGKFEQDFKKELLAKASIRYIS
ncbi:SurA N-terminal domain-containing protein [Candidatus Dependentiae bacterium]